MPGCVSKSSGSPVIEARSHAAVARSLGAGLPAAYPSEVRVPANRRTGLLLASLAWLLWDVLPGSAWAARAVRVYEVDVSGQSTTALQDAMRQALVRATGRRESANDPALASLIEEAPKYVKSYSPGPRGETQVIFDRVAVE